MVLSPQHIDLAQQLFLKLCLGIFDIGDKINAITTDQRRLDCFAVRVIF